MYPPSLMHPDAVSNASPPWEHKYNEKTDRLTGYRVYVACVEKDYGCCPNHGTSMCIALRIQEHEISVQELHILMACVQVTSAEAAHSTFGPLNVYICLGWDLNVLRRGLTTVP